MNLVPRFLGGKTAIVLAVGIAACELPSAAHAALIMDISVNSGAPIVVADNGPNDSNSSPNSIAYNTTINGFALSLISAATDNPGTSASGHISDTASAFENESGSPINVVVTLSDSGFTPVTEQPPILLSNFSANLVSTGAGDFTSLLSTANTTSAPTQTLTASGSMSESVPFSSAGTYSLQSVMTLQLSPGASATSNSTTSVTPEPASIGVFVGLGALGVLARRRRSSRLL